MDERGLYRQQDGGGGTPPPAGVPSAGTPPPAGTPAGDGQTPPPAETWDEVVAGLPEPQRALYEQHTKGLKAALESERTQRAQLAKELRTATEKMEQGSQARTQLEQATARLEEAERRAGFYGEASRPEIGCINPQLAYLAAREVNAFDARGNIDWKALQQQYPELFRAVRAPTPPANPGTGQPPQKGFDMNDALRRSARRNNL